MLEWVGTGKIIASNHPKTQILRHKSENEIALNHPGTNVWLPINGELGSNVIKILNYKPYFFTL